jgi:CheY-like chemotaxis protein
MIMRTKPRSSGGERLALCMARVLLVHSELAPRLALQTILQAGGYSVDVAASPSEAFAKLDEAQYDLVLSDSRLGSRNGRSVLAYARVKPYRPATAIVTSSEPELASHHTPLRQQMRIYTENLPNLLGEIAELIGVRASRRYRPLRQAV